MVTTENVATSQYARAVRLIWMSGQFCRQLIREGRPEQVAPVIAALESPGAGINQKVRILGLSEAARLRCAIGATTNTEPPHAA